MTQRFSITRRADFSPDDEAELKGLSQQVYPPEAMTDWPGRHIEWARTTHSIRCWSDDVLVAHAGLLVRSGRIDDRTVTLGGVGGVMVHPGHRRQGLATATMHRAPTWFAEQQVDFAVLVCVPELFTLYGRAGWQVFEDTLWVQQPGGRVPFTFNRPMTLSVGLEAPITGALDLCGLPW
ncbi:MAG: GNAT family N-acetyltransferase [Bradymonadia bacterium]